MAEPMDEAMEVTGTGAIVAPEASMDDNTEEATDVATDVAIAAPEEPTVDAIDVLMADTMAELIVCPAVAMDVPSEEPTDEPIIDATELIGTGAVEAPEPPR
jgi:hypothetical protein